MEQNLLDHVTGLPVYENFIVKLREEFDERWDDSLQYALVSMDINNFKYINRIYGFEKANDLLRNAVELVMLDNPCIISGCRSHSDHVMLFFRFDYPREQMISQVEQIGREFVRRYARQFASITLHLNNGIYFIENPQEDVNTILDKANAARRVAKGNFCIDSVVFEPAMLKRKDEDVKVLTQFDDAVKNDRIEVFLQPKVDVISQKVKGAEALSRLYDPEGKLMYPDSYIPVLENSGKIVELDWFVIRTVFANMEHWLKKSYHVVPISINLSRMHFFEPDISTRLIQEFEMYEIPKKLVEFELTESLFFAEADRIVHEINILREYGFKISMDDFGVGYSTLHALGTLPVDIIKFDKGFVHSSMETDGGYEIFSALVSVFRRINYDVVCEGVETKQEEKKIFESGCDTVQGFLYDRPIPMNEFVSKYLM